MPGEAALSTSGDNISGELYSTDPSAYDCSSEAPTTLAPTEAPTEAPTGPMTETPIGAPTTEEEGLEAEKEQTAALFSNMARIFGLVSGGLFVLIVLACQGARCAGKAGFLGRVGVVDHFGVLYSTFDWAMDLFSAAEMYDAGGTNYAKTALTVCGIHVAANAVGMFAIMYREKKRDNIDVRAFSDLNLLVTGVQILGLTNLKVIAGYLPWKTLNYKGNPSRYTYMCTNIIPLVFENIPQLVNQMMFLMWSGGSGNQITQISTMGSGLAVLFQLIRALSQGFVVKEKHLEKKDAEGGGGRVVPAEEEEEVVEVANPTAG